MTEFNRQVPNVPAREIIRAALTFGAVALFLYLLFYSRDALLLIFFAITLASAFRKPLHALEKRGISTNVGMIMIVGGIGMVALFVMRSIGTMLWTQTQDLLALLPSYYGDLREMAISSEHFVTKRLAAALPEVPSAELFGMGNSAETATPPLLTLTASIDTFTRVLLNIAVVLLIIRYQVAHGETGTRSLMMLLPTEHRAEARTLINEIDMRLGSFVRGQLLLMLSIAVASLIAYLLIGLPYAFVLAIFVGLMEAIPIIGPILGVVPALIVALTIDPMLALWVLIAGGIIQQLENNILVPRIMGQTLGVNALVTLLAFIAFSSLFGVLGAVVAVPLAAVIQVLLDRYALRPSEIDRTIIIGRDSNSVLRYRAQELIHDIRRQMVEGAVITSRADDDLHDSLEAIATDLDSVLAAEGGSA